MLKAPLLIVKKMALSVTFIAGVATLSIYSLGNAHAQQYSANSGWGTGIGGTATSSESATMHAQYGVIAGQVEAAERGILISTGSSTIIQVIGSQSIVSTDITGDGNSVSQEADQDTTNSGNQQYQ